MICKRNFLSSEMISSSFLFDSCNLVLSVGLQENFAEVSVSEVDCPDLTAAPYHLAGQGLSGSPTIVELGGPPYLLPTVDRTKLYDLVAVGRKVLPKANEFIAVGAGAGPHPHINSNCEVNFNFLNQQIIFFD